MITCFGQESLRTFYYNDKKPSPLLDITPVEALRWRVRTGIAYPEFYSHSPQVFDALTMQGLWKIYGIWRFVFELQSQQYRVVSGLNT
jgi:hypothetical protein